MVLIFTRSVKSERLDSQVRMMSCDCAGVFLSVPQHPPSQAKYFRVVCSDIHCT